MSWAPLLLLALGALCAGAAAQFVLTQPSSLSVTPGQTARLPCVMSSGFNIDDYTVYWYQQRPGSPPRFLLYYYSDTDKRQDSGVPARFSASKDPSSNTFHLLLTGALGEDDADYYCQGYYGTTDQYIFGGGTQLNVLTGETQAPTLSIFPPSLEEVEKNKATVVCLLQDFYPASLDVTWKVDGQIFTNGVEKSRATKQSENNLFMASSYLSLPPMDWSAEKTVTCQVTHQGKTFEKSVKKSECV